MSQISHDNLSNAIRFLAIDAVEQAKSGHPGMPMGAADIATVLFKDFLKFSAKNPTWENRDRFILSAGHGSMLLYALLYLTGYEDFPLEQIKNFRQFGSNTAGHPEYGHGFGIETTTGPLGQGLATAVGLALGERMHNARFGDTVINHYTYVIAGDGDLMEGVSHEAIGLAGHLKLNKLIVLFDDNNITIDGDTSKSFSGCHLERFRASGWNAIQIDGHNPSEIHHAISQAQQSDKPTLIACKTVIGKGAPNKQNSAGVHGSPLGGTEIELVRKHFNWNHAPFHIPDPILLAWQDIGKKHDDEYQKWSANPDVQSLRHFTDCNISEIVNDAVSNHKKKLDETKPTSATRVASQNILEVINPLISQLIGGSADLTGSNNTLTKGLSILSSENYDGRYIHYGIREFGMAAAMNGLCLYGGYVPYGGTFLVFSDYSRPAIRLAALMGVGVIHVLTHDSIGLGEDGPTHQPIEHLASLRAMPNLLVFRPCDEVETTEAWACAIQNRKTPSVLALSRQNLAYVRANFTQDNLVSKGAYVLYEAHGKQQATLYASGSEVEIIVAARKELQDKHNIGIRVISVPCMELFFQQSQAYQDSILSGEIRIAVEAGIKQGWETFISDQDSFIGMKGFGASAPAPVLYEKFGITKENVIELVLNKINA